MRIGTAAAGSQPGCRLGSPAQQHSKLSGLTSANPSCMWLQRRQRQSILALQSVIKAQLRGTRSLAHDEALDAKREKRKRRRQHNRELRESLSAGAFERQWGHQAAGGSKASSSRESSRGWCQQGEPDIPDTDFGLFQAMFGKPRSRTEQQQFSRAWKQWQAAASGGAASSGSSRGAYNGSGSSGRTGGFGSAGSSNGWDDNDTTWGGGTRSGSRGRGYGSAGNSAGPQWGKAEWTWEDFQQASSRCRHGSNNGSTDYETWYEPPPSGSRKRAAGAGTGTGWGFYSSSWQQAFEDAWRQQSGAFGSGTGGSSNSSSWHQASGGFGAGAGSSWQQQASAGSGASSAAVRSSMALLGLEHSWLSQRCGKALRRAYLAKAKSEHPDMHAGTGNATAAEQRFKAVQAAYQALLALVLP